MKEHYRLVYYLWYPSNMTEKQKEMFNFHLNHLKCFSNIFHESLFVISVDDVEDSEYILKLERVILDMGYVKNVTFKIVSNNNLVREAETFKTEVVDKISSDEGITFFAHTKGMGNVENGTFDNCQINTEAVEKWVSFMYYMNLKTIEDVKHQLYGNSYCAYGTLVRYSERVENRYRWEYMGSYQWIHGKKLQKYLDRNNTKIPELTDRLYAEIFLGEVLPFDFDYFYSHKWYYFTFADPYARFDEYANYILQNDEDIKNDFYNFYKKMKTKEALW